MAASQKKENIIFIVVALLTLCFAQLSSFLIEAGLPQGRSIELFPFLHFTHVRNHGGIFGIAQGKGWIFSLVSVLFLSAMIFIVLRTQFARKIEYMLFGLIVGGGTGNILDRLVYGSVIDFIDIRGISFWNYIFNTADVMIHIGVWPLVILGLFFADDDEAQEAGPELSG